MSEVVQPSDIDRSELEGGLFEAHYPRVYARWLAQVCPQLGLDPHKLLMGHALITIEDDRNMLLQPGEKQREDYLVRLDWEINESVLPEDIKEKLRQVKEVVTGRDWIDPAAHSQTRETWEQAKIFADQTRRTRPDLEEAVMYYIEHDAEVSKHWREFLG